MTTIIYSRMIYFLFIFIVATINFTLVYTASRPTFPKAVDLNQWSKLVEVPADHNPLQYPSYSQSRTRLSSARPNSPPAKPVDLKEWSKLIEVPADHHPLEYPSLGSPIKDHERVHTIHSPKNNSHSSSSSGKLNGIDASLKRKPVLDTGIVETRIPTRRAHLKALIQTKTAKEEHYIELENLRSRDRQNRQNNRKNKSKRLSEI